MSYTYKSPLDDGYEPVTLTKREVKNYAPHQRLDWMTSIRCYHKNLSVKVEVYMSPLAVLLNMLLYPVAVLRAGLSNLNEVNREYYGLFNQQKMGKFTRFEFSFRPVALSLRSADRS